MKNSKPQLLQNFKFKVEVTNADQHQRLKEHCDLLLPYLRKKLFNGKIDILIEEKEMTEKQTIYSPLDKLNYMVEQNPNLVTLYKEFDLEIS